MGRIILHIGTHKTGTTSIQRFADRNRVQLYQMGLHYPCYSAVGVGRHYAHLDVAKAMMGASKRLDDQALGAFCAHIREHAKSCEATLVSAEPFWRGLLKGDGDYWGARRAFIARVTEYFPPDETQILLVCRGQADLVESLFQEDVKVNRLRRNLKTFAAEKEMLLHYLEQAEAWAEMFPNLRVLNFEGLQRDNALIRNFFGAIGFDVGHLPPAPRYNESIKADFVTALRMLNRSGLNKKQLAHAAGMLAQLQEDPVARAWPRRSLWNSAPVREGFDQQFHAANDSLMQRYGDPAFPIRSRTLPDSTKYGERMTEAALTLLLGHLVAEGQAQPRQAARPTKPEEGDATHEMLGR
ncbi:hypothetical protein KHP62_11780 [Rhodobacteraceae bacterium NNCM2]|nr:hypothetical protein [Coraliihabitans acroporae]